jgi:glycosyltransferase involved in cell wall biosynthesis
MSRDAPLTVVVPVYNEGANIARWYAEAKPYLPAGAKVRVVFDFDGDDTLPVVRELSREGAPLVPLRNEGKGVLGAIVTGLRSASEGPLLVSMADCSDDFSALPRMMDAYRAGADVVVASRYAAGGRQIGGPWLKGQLARWGGRSLRWLARFPVSDATNSYRLYDADLVRRTPIESAAGFVVGFEITLRAWMAGAKIAEVPATWRDRTEGKSRFDLRKWLPRYAQLWLTAMRHGLAERLRLGTGSAARPGRSGEARR